MADRGDHGHCCALETGYLAVLPREHLRSPEARGVVTSLGVLVRVRSWCGSGVVRHNKSIGKEVTVSVTEDGIDYRAGLVSIDVPWDRIQHVDSRKDYWILVVDRVHRIILYKGAFTREQLAELSLFLSARPSVTGSRRRLG
jgi:YcxB-like protein